jgi:hypothetical protein
MRPVKVATVGWQSGAEFAQIRKRADSEENKNKTEEFYG